MKTSKLFWGIFLLVFGGFILLENYFNISIDFDWMLKLWPIVLILIGLKIMLKDKNANTVLVVTTAIIVGFIAYSFLFKTISCKSFQFFRDSDVKEKRETISQQNIPSIKKSNLQVEFKLGEFQLKSDSLKLIDGEVIFSRGDYHFDGEILDSTASFKLISSDENPLTIFEDKIKNKLNLNLGTKVDWNIELNTNFVKNNFKLENLKVQTFQLESNFSKGEVFLNPTIQESQLNINLNFSKLKILIPENIGVQIHTDKNFSSINLIGFTEIKENQFISKNFGNANRKVFINLNSNFSSVEVEHIN